MWGLHRDGNSLVAELLDHGRALGVELQFMWNGELLHARRYSTKDLALAEAANSRNQHEAEGWTDATWSDA